MPGMCSRDISATMTPSAKQRRANKPMMERRRRERINQCLNELKSLVLKAQKKDPSRFTKLEKADILEMTVRHVKSLNGAEQFKEKYESGFARCALEVNSFLQGLQELPANLVSRVTSHLNNTIMRVGTSQEESSPTSPQNICPITRKHESVPLASLENGNGCFTISKNITEPVERTMSSNFLEMGAPTQAFFITVESSSKAKNIPWCPPSPPNQESSAPSVNNYLNCSSRLSGSSEYIDIKNWRLSCSTADEGPENIIRVHSSSGTQEAPLNLVTTLRSYSPITKKFRPSTSRIDHTFPPSPPSSISSSPKPHLDQSIHKISLVKPEVISSCPKVTQHESGPSESSKYLSKTSASKFGSLTPTCHYAFHWRPWSPPS